MIRILGIVILVLAAVSAGAQNTSNRGKEFWVGYGHHQFMEPGQPNSQEMVIYLSAEQPATVVVSINGTTWTRTYNVPANTVIATEYMPKNGVDDPRLYSVPPTFGGTGGEGLFNRGINIKSDVPIVAYAHTFGSASSGATMLLPIDSWGNVYHTLNSRQTYASNCFSWAYVVASQDNTVIEITPSVETRTLRPAGVTFSVTLNKGQIYQVIGNNPSGTGSTALEMTGTKFKSVANAAGVCPPIAVFAGSSRTGNPVPCGSGGGDNDNQQCFPTSTWGKQYLIAPTSSSTGASTFMTNTYKIVARDPGTVVRRNGVPLVAVFAPGSVVQQFFFQSNTADYIEADKPIMVAQYMTGGACLNGGLGDPEMMFISPIEQGIKRVGFYRNNRESIQVNYLTLIIPTNGIPSLRIDGSPAFDHSYAHPQKPGYSVVVKRWNAAQAQATVSSDSAFTAVTYGLGSVESYGYNAGTFLNNLNLVGSIRNDSDTATLIKEHPFTCKNSPITLSAFYLYKPTSLTWQLSTLAAVLTPSADVTQISPAPVDSSVINGIKYYKYSLPGTYMFTDTGTFSIPILSSHPTIENCTFSEKLSYDIKVKATPRPTFILSHTGCTLDTAIVTAKDTTLNNYIVNRYTWTLPAPPIAPTTVNTQQVKMMLPPGNHTVKLEVVTRDGCVGDTTQAINVFNKPVSNFGYLPASICENTAVTFIDSSGITGTGASNNFYWDFGNGNIVNATSNANQTVTYPTFGTYIVKHVVRTSASCFSDTVVKTVTVYAKPRTSFSFPTNCLPTNGQVDFTNGTTIPDGQAITTWAWTFNDPNATAGNPNTSALQTPSHIFAEGTYPVNLSATSAQGCVKDTTVNVPVKITPALNFPAITPVCQNVAAFSIATAAVTNGVTGSGVYRGPGTTAAGIFDPAAAGVGTHNIWYVFTTTGGCIDSVQQTIQVRAKPVVSYTFPVGGCLPTSGFAQFNGIAALSDGQTVNTWAWTFNDPNANAGNPNTSNIQNPTHNFTANGTYNIQLAVTSSGGCAGDTTITHNFNTKPALAYPALASICVNAGGTVNVATASVTNGVSGTGSYSGPGTTAAGIFTPATAGVGTHTIQYKFTTPNGCADSITQTILVKAKPIVSYTFPVGGCLPTSGFAQFNGNAALSDGQTVNTWAWTFNDPNANAGNPNTSNIQNPSHNFTANGTYNIQLAGTSSGGCAGDTTITHNFNTKPALAYPALASICVNAGGTVNVATASVTNGVSGTGSYSGPGTTAAGIFTPATAGVGTHTIQYKFTTPNGCADSITQTILVKAKPIVSYTFPVGGCLPTSGFAQFNGNAALSDGQTVSTWAWTFNDPNANAGNPNTSNIQNPSHNFTANGTYSIQLAVTSSGGCAGDTTITHNFNTKPALAYPALASICVNAVGTVNVATASVTNGVSGTGVYSGPGTTAAGIFTPATAGVGTHTIQYKFTTPNGCADSITQTILVKAKPVVSYTFPTGGCLPTTGLAQFNGNAALSDGQTVNTWGWTFNDPNANAGNPNNSALQNPTHNFTANGTYNVLLTVSSSGGCLGDTTIAHNFNIKPALAYTALASVCVNNAAATVNVASASVTNGASGTGVYSGPGTTAAGIFTPATAGVGTHTIWYKFTTPNGCTDSISQTILVKAKPVVSYTFPTGGCLPTNGLAQFNGNAALSDGQTVNTWAWTFNDPNANAGNPNTSNVQNPSHNFTANGTYNVQLVVTSSGGCSGDTTIAHNFNIKPALAYPPLSTICQSIPGTVSVATASVTNGATGTGVYSGPGTSAAGQFNPSVAGSGTHTIWYKFTTPNGCTDSISQTIGVDPKPVAAFTATPSVCLGTAVTFTDGSSISSGSITQWRWIFGDGNVANNNNGNTFNHTYATADTFVAKLVTESANGCVSDTATRTVIVHPIPVADFTTSASVCMPGGAVNFTNQSSLTGNNNALSYVWNFGDLSAPNTSTNPSHVYAAINNYTITLTATSAASCSHQVSKPFNAFFEKPIAAFEATPDTLCQGKPTVFDDLSTDPAGSAITSWTWNFADGSAPVTTQNPVKTYAQPGNYAVTLRVSNAAGCISDLSTSPVVVYLQPVVDAGPSFTVLQGSTITFNPVVNSTSLNFVWSPAVGLSSATVLKPSLTVAFDQIYTLTATGQGGCTASDFMSVKVLQPIDIPNAFSPNGDGINDRWEIKNLIDYADCDIQIFNRYGQRIYQQSGYTKAWDGTINGSPMPVGVYYYIIDLKNGLQKRNGSVTIIR
jgi:gliding motility-associated-like protein